jgi:glyoxylase-like metal-dependent hydrolase (beta-lactamase superfamily II)
VAAVAGGRAADPQSDLLNGPRLYVMDCGFIPAMNPELYGLTAAELTSAADFVTPCYLVVHPGGTLLFDVGQIPDSEFPADGSPADAGFFRADRPLIPQLAEIGYAPEDITYMAMSHYHLDHSANANAFAGSTWIVQRAERDAMFAENAPGITNRSYYDQLEDADTVILEGEDYDVFGDGTVVLEFTPGHTPGHQSLYLDLASRGPVLLAGDLYHYVEERELDRVPSFDFDQEMTRATRRQVEAFLVETGAELWINHNLELFESLEKSPAFYD